MFESLSDRLSDVFGRLTKKGALTDSDVAEAMREVRLALLEADVALPVVKEFVAAVKEKAIGQDVVRSVTPGQMVVKIVHDHLVEVLGGGGNTDIDLNAPAPVPIMMVGLQGSGKTTTTGKIAYRLTHRDKKKVLMASLDTRRPAAQEQLKVLGEQANVPTLPIIAGQGPVDIARRAMTAAKLQGYDVVILDTAGRLHVDEALMQEIEAVKREANPHEVMLVADSLTGQDAVTVAQQFHERIGLTGIALTRVDGDGRGGAALSMRAVTGVPLKLMGLGEKLEALEVFHADRIANRILGMGDIVSLVEKAAETIDQQEAEKMAAKLAKGKFDLDDLSQQLKQMRKMGGMQGMLAMLPGVAKMKDQLAKANIDDKAIKRQEAIISSMTPKERKNPQIIQAKRKIRIAKGSGTTVQDVNKLLKQHQQMADMMKRMAKLGKKGMMRGGLGALFGGGGGMPPGGFGGPGGGFPPGGLGGPGGGFPPGGLK
ncbi:signal recognition particle protein [Zavarzinia compransoris]|uniref:signal recognition particle protein n=1 Tax=Zavarzinia marina TaxID=2911065 RepID=UPI001F1A4B62|nr:signal recognition particle protein [Zavarzinia marina]MCF4165936.1 signal recognition particle protein [Zavarzinia marina]